MTWNRYEPYAHTNMNCCWTWSTCLTCQWPASISSILETTTFSRSYGTSSTFGIRYLSAFMRFFRVQQPTQSPVDLSFFRVIKTGSPRGEFAGIMTFFSSSCLLQHWKFVYASKQTTNWSANCRAILYLKHMAVWHVTWTEVVKFRSGYRLITYRRFLYEIVVSLVDMQLLRELLLLFITLDKVAEPR